MVLDIDIDRSDPLWKFINPYRFAKEQTNNVNKIIDDVLIYRNKMYNFDFDVIERLIILRLY